MHQALSHVISSLKCSQQPSKGDTPIFILQMGAWRWPSQGPLSLCPHSSCVLPCPNLQHAQGSWASLSGQLFLPLLNLKVIPKSQRASPPRGPAGPGGTQYVSEQSPLVSSPKSILALSFLSPRKWCGLLTL